MSESRQQGAADGSAELLHRQVRPTATRESFARAAELAADLGDDELMRAAWS